MLMLRRRELQKYLQTIFDRKDVQTLQRPFVIKRTLRGLTSRNFRNYFDLAQGLGSTQATHMAGGRKHGVEYACEPSVSIPQISY